MVQSLLVLSQVLTLRTAARGGAAWPPQRHAARDPSGLAGGQRGDGGRARALPAVRVIDGRGRIDSLRLGGGQEFDMTYCVSQQDS